MELTNRDKNLCIKKYLLSIGSIKIYEDYIIAQLNEGITLNLESAQEFMLIAKKHFSSKPFTYITVRKNSYAVDPMLYLRAIKIRNLKAIAIVSNKPMDVENIKIEKHFFNKPMDLFKTLPEAISWGKIHTKA